MTGLRMGAAAAAGMALAVAGCWSSHERTGRDGSVDPVDGTTDPDVDSLPDATTDPDVDGPDVPDAHWVALVGDGVLSTRLGDVIVRTDGSVVAPGTFETSGGDWIRGIAILDSEGHVRDLWALDGLEGFGVPSVQETPDGLLAVAGIVRGAGQDVWVGLVDGEDVVTQVALGGDRDEDYPSVLAKSDGTLVVAALTESWSGGGDVGIVALDRDMGILWSKVVGGPDDDEFFGRRTVVEGPGGRVYMLAGLREPEGGTGYTDAWIVALDADGELLWQRALGAGYHDAAGAIVVDEEGITLAGQTDNGGFDSCAGWLVRMSHAGNVVWQKGYGWVGCDAASGLVRHADGSYTLVGNVQVDDPDGFHYDMWVAHVDHGGAVLRSMGIGRVDMAFGAGIALIGDDVVVVGQWQDPTGYTQGLAARVGLDASYDGECDWIEVVDSTVRDATPEPYTPAHPALDVPVTMEDAGVTLRAGDPAIEMLCP